MMRNHNLLAAIVAALSGILLMLNLSSENFILNEKTIDLLNENVTRYVFILIPGNGGNQLHAKLNKTNVENILCTQTTDDYELLWFRLKDIIPYMIDCFVENIKLVYDNRTRTSSSTPGVNVVVKGFGQTETVEYLDEFKLERASYFNILIDALVTNFNYTKGVNVRGAPYDWRYAPNELNSYYMNLKSLVEESYELNGKSKIILVAHSMGNPVTVYWLNNFVSQAWKDKYIRSFVGIAGPWGGSVKTMEAMASGYNLDIPFVNRLTARKIQRASMANIFLLPSANFWSTDEVLVSTPLKNYSVQDYKQFFQDMNYEIGYEMYKDTNELMQSLEAPNVEMHCLYGINLDTPERIFYDNYEDFPDTISNKVYGNGDGTVNYRSLTGFMKWIDKQNQTIKYMEFDGVEHTDILKHQPLVDYILNLLYD